ncbi:hypothetical protein FB451DRAFT_1391449 [Mycena latifolia]|nr:hypothetical protein FB451DRAFT_1391449 [Mycena latifolia]
MENDALHPLVPPPSHCISEDDTRAALRALELVAVERDAQVTRLGVQLQYAREDTKRARAEASEARAETQDAQGQLKETEAQLAALHTKGRRGGRRLITRCVSTRPYLSFVPANPTPNCASVRTLPSLPFPISCTRAILTPAPKRRTHDRTPRVRCPSRFRRVPRCRLLRWRRRPVHREQMHRPCGDADGRRHVHIGAHLHARADIEVVDDMDAAIPVPAVPAGLPTYAHAGRVPAAAPACCRPPECASATNPNAHQAFRSTSVGRGPTPNFPNTSLNPGANSNWSRNPNAQWSPNPNVRDRAGGNGNGDARRSASWNGNGSANLNPSTGVNTQRSPNPNPNTSSLLNA